MPAQSKFIKFLKRCCCCSANSDDAGANRGSNKSKQAKKETRKNRKKLRERERRERWAVKKSKHSIDEQSIGTQTDDDGMEEFSNLDVNNNIKIQKHLQPSASFPNLKDVKKRLLPLWNPRSMPNMLKSSKTSFLTTPANVMPAALSNDHPSLHHTSASFPNMKDVKKCLLPLWNPRSMPDMLKSSKTVSLTTPNLTSVAFSDYQPTLHLSGQSMVSLNGVQETMEPSTSSSLSSWEELEIPPRSLSESIHDCPGSTLSTSLLGNWEIISINDILDGISPSMSSTSSTSSSFSFLEEESTQRSGTYSHSLKRNSVSSSVSLSTEMNTPQSVQGASEDLTVSDELPTPIVPKMRKFYYELWPPNPWLSSKYKGFPEQKKLKPHERDDYWTTDRDGDPLRIEENVHFTWCDATGIVRVVRKHQDGELSQDIPPPCSEEYIYQTQSEANMQRKDEESINWSAGDKISTDDDSDASEEKEYLCLLPSAPICSDENSTHGSNVAEVKSSREALLQQASVEDIFSEQPLNILAGILSSIPTFPVYDIKPATISKFHHSGHVFTEGLFQFINDSDSFDTHSCAISHTLLVVTFYLFGLQSGDLLDSHNLQSTSIKKWLCKTIYVANALHRSLFKRCKYTPATEAFKIVRDYFHLNSLAWRGKQGDSGIVSRRLRMKQSNLFLDMVKPYNLVSSLAFHTTQLDPTEGEAILYAINRNFFLLLPTLDNRVVLIDIHPHRTLGSGAIILFCPKNTQSIQDMLNEFYQKTIQPFYSYSLGLANILFCPTNDDTRLIPRSLEEWISGI